MGHDRAVSHSESILFDIFTEDLVEEPKEMHRVLRGDGPPMCDEKRQLLKDFPWLEEYISTQEPDEDDSFQRKSKLRKDPDDNSPQVCMLSEDQIQAVFDELQRMRMDWHNVHGYGASDFVMERRGGGWTHDKKNIFSDGLKWYARGADAVEWCIKFGLQTTDNYAWPRHGEDIVAVFGTQWCRRIQTFYNYYTASDDQPHFHYTDVHVPLEEDHEFGTVMATMPLESHAYKRSEEIKSVWPVKC